MLSDDKLNDHPFVITSTIPWNKEAMTTLNVIAINLHTWLTANLYHLAFQLIIWYILRNIAEFHIVPSTILLRHGLDFSKSVTRFSNLLLITLTTVSSLLICWFAAANLVIVSNNFEIWSQRFQRSESTITLVNQISLLQCVDCVVW